MGDVGDQALIDISNVSLRELLDDVDESALTRVLDRILEPEQSGGHFGFNSSI